LSAQRSLEDLVLMPEVEARRALAGTDLVFSLLAPVGHHLGRGVLRVLHVHPRNERIELVCGYESYERYD
jgi:hypothetical protein